MIENILVSSSFLQELYLTSFSFTLIVIDTFKNLNLRIKSNRNFRGKFQTPKFLLKASKLIG